MTYQNNLKNRECDKKGRAGFVLVFLVALLVAMGLLMQFDTSSAEVLDRLLDKSLYAALLKQLFYALLGLVCAFFVFKVGYQPLLQRAPHCLLAITLLLLLVFVPGIGHKVNGAYRWIWIGGVSLQPSEFAKYLIPFYYIHVVSKAGKLSLFSFLKLLATLAVPLGLILIEPDNGTAAIILASLFVLLILTRIRWIYWALPLLILTALGLFAASRMPHVAKRIEVYLHPELDLLGKGHQPYQAKIAAGSGKLLGRGPGGSVQKLDYLPECGNDYIAAIFAEEFGFVGISVLITLYMALAAIGFYVAMHASSVEGFYVGTLITFLIGFQAFLNLGVVSGLLPSKGTNLPFFSHGGSSLIVNLMAVALLVRLSRERQYA